MSEPLKSSDESPGPHVLHIADQSVFARFGRMLRQVLLGLVTTSTRSALLSDHPRAAHQCGPFTTGCIHVASLKGWRAWRLSARIADELEDPPELIHAWGSDCVPAIERWAERAQIPMLVHALSAADVLALTKRGPRAQRYVAGACQRFCQALGGGKPASHFPIRRFSPALILPDERHDSPRTTHFTGIIWTGRIDDETGLETLLEAVTILRNQDRYIEVMLVGQSPDENGRAAQRVWSAINARQLADRVSIINEPEVWDEAMHGLDVCVVPSREHDLSLAPLLAMSMGKVVIASRDQVADWFVEDRTAWFFTPGSGSELARLLLRYETERQAADELGALAREYVRERHTISNLAAELADFYRTVAFPQKTVPFRHTAGSET